MKQRCETDRKRVTLMGSINLHNIHSIVAYLGNEAVADIMHALPPEEHTTSTFVQVIKVRYFIQKYLNRTDRSLHVSFYAHPLFQRMEYDELCQIANQHSDAILYLLSSYQRLHSQLSLELADFDPAFQILDSITESLTDPQIPFPKLRKQNIGIHCNSSLQYFLVDKLFRKEDEQPEQSFQALHQHLKNKWSSLSQVSQQQAIAYECVMSQWFLIDYSNFQNFMVPGHTNHNLIVLLIGLIDLTVDSLHFYIQNILDQFHSFVQFNVRFCIFRNTILALEETFSFLFEDYSNYCLNNLKLPKDLRNLSIWHIALSKWYLHMQQFHEKHFNIFFYIFCKVNLTEISEENTKRINEDLAFIQMKNRIELGELQLLKCEYQDESTATFDFLQADGELQKQLTREYLQYIVDISINEFSVHWCGSSAHILHLPYENFQAHFVAQFKTYLTKVIALTRNLYHSSIVLDQTLCSLLSHLDCDYVKPLTLVKIICLLKEMAAKQMPKYCQSLLCKKIADIQYYIHAQDKKVEILNCQNNILNQFSEKYSIIIEDEDVNKALKNSISTCSSRSSKSQYDPLSLSFSLTAKASIYEDF